MGLISRVSSRTYRKFFDEHEVKGDLKEYSIIGRKLPSAMEPNPKLFRQQIFAPDSVAAKSRFWKFLSYYQKINKKVGEIVECSEVHESHPGCVKNYMVSGSDTTLDPPLKTCTESTETFPSHSLSPKCTERWPLDTELDQAPSRSSEPNRSSLRVPTTTKQADARSKHPIPTPTTSHVQGRPTRPTILHQTTKHHLLNVLKFSIEL